MIQSGTVSIAIFDFKEDDMEMLDEIKKLKDIRNSHSFSAEEDYIIIAYWDTKKREDVRRIMKRGGNTIRQRHKELMQEDKAAYRYSLLATFAERSTNGEE